MTSPFGERCEHDCGRHATTWYVLEREDGSLTDWALCDYCSRINADALTKQGWRVLVD